MFFFFCTSDDSINLLLYIVPFDRMLLFHVLNKTLVIQLCHLIVCVVHDCKLSLIVLQICQVEFFICQTDPKHVVDTGNQVGMNLTNEDDIAKIELFAII